MVKKIFRFYLIISFFFWLTHSFFFATYAVFLAAKGLNLLQINLVNLFFMIGVVLMEVPTGAYADLIGRKKSFVLSCFIFGTGMLIYYFSSSFWWFVVAELVSAAGVAFMSGSLEAWLVDSLKHHGFNGNLNDIFKRDIQVNEIGMMMGGLIGGYIGTVNLALPWLCGAIGTFLVGFFCLFMMREDYFLKNENKPGFGTMKTIISESVQYGIRNKSILYIVIFGAVYTFTIQGPNMQWQILFGKDFGLSTVKLGWIYAGITLCILVGSQLSGWLLKILKKEKHALMASQIVLALGIFAASRFVILTPVLMGFLMSEIGRGLFSPLKKSYLNKRIPSKTRATIISFDSMIEKMAAALGLILSGIIAKNFSISLAWLILSLILLVSIPFLLKFKNGE